MEVTPNPARLRRRPDGRFNGVKQGIAAWVWAAVVVAVLDAVAGSKYDVLGTLNAFPRIPSTRAS